VKKLKLLLVAVVMTIAMSVGVVSPALAHKTCANNQHQHFIAGSGMQATYSVRCTTLL
jgi:hypothetical protein